MERNVLFETARRNIEWLKENYERLKKEYDKRWIVVEDRKVIHHASTFDEIMQVVRRCDPRKVLVEYIQSESVAMFF